MSLERPCLSVVVPCFNERRTILQLIQRVLASPWVAEVIVVDDGSTDGTRELVNEVDDQRLRVILHPHNMGKGAALRTGFAYATSDYVVVQDADLEYDPDEYGVLLAPLEEDKADVVLGSRFMSGRPHRVLYFWHSVGNRALTLLSNMTTGLNISDMETCYKAFRRELIQSIELNEDRFGFEPEIVAKIAARKVRIYEVGITYAGRTYSEGKKIGWRDGLRAVYCIVYYSPLIRRRRVAGRDHADQRTAPTTDEHLDVALRELVDVPNYNNWQVDLIAPVLGGRLLEIGAGAGTFTKLLSTKTSSIVACEPSDVLIDALRYQSRDLPNVTVVHGSVEHVAPDISFDGSIMLNVLEHIEDDIGALSEIRGLLRPGARLAVLSPAFPLLYSNFDSDVGHFRRYTQRSLTEAFRTAGWTVESSRYVNCPGFFAWLVVARFLNRRPTESVLSRWYDRFIVPPAKWVETRVPAPFGQSVFVVGVNDVAPR